MGKVQRLIQMLLKVEATMLEQGGEQHPWIPGFEAKQLLVEIRELLQEVRNG